MRYNALDVNGELLAVVTAEDPEDALRKAKNLNPDVVRVEEREERERRGDV